MNKLLGITFLLLLTTQIIFSQNTNGISLNIENESRKKALVELEQKIDGHIYFHENWLNDSLVSFNFNNSDLSIILDKILEDTDLNYVIRGRKIFLIKNSFINLSLPDGYFDLNGSNSQQSNQPIFQEEYTTTSQVQQSNVLTIGKQVSGKMRDVYTVSGQIKDFKTNEPISGLTITTQDRTRYTATDDNGFYSFQLSPGFHKLETSLLGYENTFQDVVVYGDGILNLSIAENAEMLDEVLVESNKDDNVKEAELGVIKINIAAIKTIPLVLGERDLLKVATTLPGIKTAGEGAAGFNVRGGRADQNLILLDDAVLYTPSHFLGFFSAINPFTTGKLDIYKASIPAEYGGRLSSVFDIETKDGNVEKFAGEGSIGPITGNLTLEVPVVENKASLIAGVRATYSNWILRSLSEESLKDSQASFYDGILKYQHNLNDKNDIEATLYYSNDKFSITTDSVYSYNNRLASLKWNHDFDDKNKGEVILVNSQYKYNIEYEADANRDFDFGYQVNESQLKFNFKYLHSNKHKFDYGISSKLYSIEPGNISPVGNSSIIESKSISKEKGLESAVYISDLFEINDKLLFDMGLRYSVYASLGSSTQNIYETGAPKNEGSVIGVETYDNNEIIETYGGPDVRFSARYFLTPSLSVKASYNKTFQYIHLLSSNTTVSPTDTWKLSDSNIKPQKANQYALGLYKNIDSKDLEISLEGYYKKMDDILDYKVGAELILNENIETELLQGEGKAYGVEFLLKKKKGRLNGYFGYSYSRSFVKLDSPLQEERVNNGDYFPANYDKPHDFSLVGNYKLTQRYSISTNFTFQTGRPITYPVGKFVFAGEEQVLYSDRNKYRIPDYYRLDLGFNIEGNHKKNKLAHSFWNISVYNVLGRNNPYSVFFVNEDGNIKAYKTSIFSIPVPTITYNFKF